MVYCQDLEALHESFSEWFEDCQLGFGPISWAHDTGMLLQKELIKFITNKMLKLKSMNGYGFRPLWKSSYLFLVCFFFVFFSFSYLVENGLSAFMEYLRQRKTNYNWANKGIKGYCLLKLRWMLKNQNHYTTLYFIK